MEKLMEKAKDASVKRPHIVLVDDDPLFIRLLQKVAEKQSLKLSVFSSPEEAYKILPDMDFDVGLFDYDLGRVTGLQLVNFLQREGRRIPILLVSHLGEIEKWRWPASIRKSVSKNAGPYSILAIAKNLVSDRSSGG